MRISNWKDAVYVAYGTAGGAGLFPVAPGTAGALVGLLLLVVARDRFERSIHREAHTDDYRHRTDCSNGSYSHGDRH